ncbi:MAG: tetratricopeptide repeat protein [Ferruginibacter sp.]
MSNSSKIGDLFEKASVRMLQLLFVEWGYRIEELKRQKSGTQHGFDIHLKVYNEQYLPIHVFVECKGSETFNEIAKRELSIKSEQLERNNFQVKDVHLFFSPTRTIDYANDEKAVEEDDYPFCIIDMMGSKNSNNDILDLFLSYNGNDEDILNYRKEILEPITMGYAPVRTFEQASLVLKARCLDRLQVFLSSVKNFDFTLLSPSYWNRIKSETNFGKLSNYYLRLDSDKQRLKEVVANNYHIPNMKAKIGLFNRVKELEKQGGLIKILSNGGEGKSTFLFSVGYDLCQERPVFLLNQWRRETLQKIERTLALLDNKNAPVLLIDDASTKQAEIEAYGEELANSKIPFIVLLSERYYRYQQMRGKDAFENKFLSEAIQFNFRSKENASEIFEKFFSLLKEKNAVLTNEDYVNSAKVFITDESHTVAERIFKVLKVLHDTKRISFVFDWDEWKEVHRGTALVNLYLLVASFYQFGNSITIDFCKQFSDYAGLSTIDIRDAVDKSPDQPIIRNGDYLQLRHEKVADWYIEDERQQDNVRAIYKEWFSNISTQFAKNLLLWTYRNSDFKRCEYLTDILNKGQIITSLKKFISDNPIELPARLELAKIFARENKPEATKLLLTEIIGLDSNNLHARTELSKIYQQQKKWKEAADILKELLDLDKENLQARTELSKIYQQQKKWKEAEDILKELLDLDKENLQARTELSKIYQQQKKWKEAEDTLKELLDLDKENLQARTELSKIYQQQKKWEEAIKYLEEYIQLDSEGLHPRTELSKIYQQQKKWKEAESILKELLDLDKENLQARTELSKIYQQQKKWKEAEDILKESLTIDKEQLHPRTELSKIYQQQKKWKEAEDILKESLTIDKEQLHPRTELSKIYQQQKKWKEAEDILKESLTIDKEQLHPRTELSKIYQQQKKWEEAIKYLEEYIKLDPEGLHPRTELSKIYQQQKKWKEAESILKELLDLDKENLQARTELSKIYQQQKKWKEAEDILKESLTIDKDQLHPRTELSKIYQQQKKWKEAEDILKESLTIDKEQLHPRTELSKIYQQQKKWEEAIKCLEEYIQLDPEGLHPRTELSRIYQQQKKWYAAEDILKESLIIEPDNYIVLTEQALLYKRWFKTVESKDEKQLLKKKHVETVVKSFQTNNTNIPILMELAILFKSRRQYRASLLFLQQIKEIDEDDLECIREQEVIYGYMANKTKAEECRKRGQEIISSNTYAKFRNRFDEQTVKMDMHRVLISDNLIGKFKYLYITKERFIEDGLGNRITIIENANVCAKLRDKDETYYSLYSQSGKIIADCLEPVFNSIESLISGLLEFDKHKK